MKTQIRQMSQADTTAVSEIVSSGYAQLAQEEGFSPEQIQRLLAERSTVSDIQTWLAEWQCFVAVLESGVIGALAVEKTTLQKSGFIPSIVAEASAKPSFAKRNRSLPTRDSKS